MEIPDQDSPWKDLLDNYFEDFMEFFFPAAHAQIDWARGYEFLDKELQKITADAAIGRRTVDKLVKVWLKTGEGVIALIHAEVQGERETDFSERVYVYHYRISDRFGQRVATFVVLTDRHRRWRPREFSYELLGTKASLRFSSVKILSYQGRETELEQSRNPFAIVVLAHLRLLETQHNDRGRLEWKLTLTKMLYDRGYSEHDVIQLFRFLDWLMFLPKPLQIEYADEMDRFEEERKMPYVTTVEQIGIEKGIEKGKILGGADILLHLLKHKLGELSESLQAQIRELSFSKLHQLTEDQARFATIADLTSWLEQQTES